jgi:peptide/nickel transport system substrate-binding protein
MEAPMMERIIQVPMGNNEIAAMKIVNDEVDTTFMLPASLIQSVVSYAPQVITHSGREKPFGYLDWWPNSMYFNCLEWPYDDPRVRWAMAYAINQQELVDVGQMGCGLISEWVFPTYPGLQKFFDATKSIREKYNVLEVNLEKTDALMAEAGFTKDAEGFWVKDGKRPPAQILASAQHFGDIAPLVVEQLRAAGFDATHASPPGVWDVKATTGILFFQGHTGSVRDPYQTMSYYHSQWVTPTGQNHGLNRSRWANPEYDAIVERISRISMEDYDALIEQVVLAAEVWYRELPEVPLVQFMHRIPYNTRYWKNWPTQDNAYVNGADFHLTGVMLAWGGTGLQPTE